MQSLDLARPAVLRRGVHPIADVPGMVALQPIMPPHLPACVTVPYIHECTCVRRHRLPHQAEHADHLFDELRRRGLTPDLQALQRVARGQVAAELPVSTAGS